MQIVLKARSGITVGFARIDDVDAALGELTWRLSADGYAVRWVRGDRRSPSTSWSGYVADHIDGDRLNNTRHNLRWLTRVENSQNRRAARGSTSRHRGAYRSGDRWRAAVTINGQRFHLGRFDDQDEAGRVVAEFRARHMPVSNEKAAA